MKKKNRLSLKGVERKAEAVGVQIVEIQKKKGNDQIRAVKLGIGGFEIIFGKTRRGIMKLSTEIPGRNAQFTELNVPLSLFYGAYGIAEHLFAIR